MMFNGLMVYGDSDTSDFTKESIGVSSVAGSAGSDTRSNCLKNKLNATLEVLKNTEETVRVQAESLALAEARIATLSARNHLSYKVHRTDHADPPHSSRSSADGCCVETSDFTSQTQEVDSSVVNTLQDNLSVIEELYRECFYETAKQEELIDMLRKSYLDVRSMERQKAARIHRLQGVVNTQRWSLERCQDIAVEVENLKSEISNFLSNSNHDSGMWERPEESLSTEVAGDLQHISGQLLRLREVLKNNCSCELDEENVKLKRINETLEIQVRELTQRLSDLETVLQDKENIERQYRNQLEVKDVEFQNLKQQLSALEADSCEQKNGCNALNLQIQQLQVLLQDRSEELARTHSQCEERSATVHQLRLELEKAENVNKDHNKVRAEVAELSAQVCQWRAQLDDGRRRMRALDEELHRSRNHCGHLERLYSAEQRAARELQAALEESRRRGAELCGAARAALGAVRRELRRLRRERREQKQKIKEQARVIESLQRCRLRSDAGRGSGSDACRSKCTPARLKRGEPGRDATGSSDTPSLEPRRRDSRSDTGDVSGGRSAPTPPGRSRNKLLCDDRYCQFPSYREVASQQPTRADADTRLSRACVCPYPARATRVMSPTDELLERVEQTDAAFAEAHRRWRRRPAPPAPPAAAGQSGRSPRLAPGWGNRSVHDV